VVTNLLKSILKVLLLSAFNISLDKIVLKQFLKLSNNVVKFILTFYTILSL